MERVNGKGLWKGLLEVVVCSIDGLIFFKGDVVGRIGDESRIACGSGDIGVVANRPGAGQHVSEANPVGCAGGDGVACIIFAT